jgi:hypothetical protein
VEKVEDWGMVSWIWDGFVGMYAYLERHQLVINATNIEDAHAKP